MPVLNMYVCGPTVYDSAHIGHARTYITTDLINRTMNDILSKPTHLVMNITDIDDKIINKAAELKCDWRVLSVKVEESFMVSMRKLNVCYPDEIIRVSEVIDGIIAYIQQIINNGFAYIATDGSVYFDSRAYIHAGYTFASIEGEFSEQNESQFYYKKHPNDFALWKGRQRTDVGFEATFYRADAKIDCYGRPGWHIECNCMIHKTIGPNIDIHLGGIDLRFPHHHNERLQANAYYHPMFANDKVWSPTFYHIGHLCIEGLKMSKSLKNFITIDEAMKTITSNQFRWMFMLRQWSQEMEYSKHTISQCEIYDTMIVNFFKRTANYPFECRDVKADTHYVTLRDSFNDYKTKVMDSLDKLDFPLVTELFADLIKSTHRYLDTNRANERIIRSINEWIHSILSKLGFDYAVSPPNGSDNLVREIMQTVVDVRTDLRGLVRDKNMNGESKKQIFTILDKWRDLRLKDIGVIIQDTKDSSLWYVE
jgi:cysteinyl-tRNA synthetase